MDLGKLALGIGRVVFRNNLWRVDLGTLEADRCRVVNLHNSKLTGPGKFEAGHSNNNSWLRNRCNCYLKNSETESAANYPVVDRLKYCRYAELDLKNPQNHQRNQPPRGAGVHKKKQKKKNKKKKHK